MADARTLEKYTRILEKAVDEASRDDLVDCLKLLSLSLAHYKLTHGELPVDNIEAIITAETLDAESMRLLEEGLLQAIAVLVEVSGQSDDAGDDDPDGILH